MKKMLNLIKNNTLFGIIIGGIIFGSIGVGATAYLYNSNEVSYTPPDSTWNVTNVKGALDSLYLMKQELDEIKSLGDATADNISLGKTAVVDGNLITGTGVDSSLSGHALADGTYYITVGITAAYRNVSQYGLAQSRTVSYVVKLVIEGGVPTVSWHKAPYTGSEDLWITAGGVSFSS